MALERGGQMWYGDFTIGLLIFGMGIALYLFFSPNLDLSDDAFSSLSEQAYTISSSLLSSGNPSDWNASSVVSVGLTDGERRLSFEKYHRFSSLNYSLAKSRMGVTADFFVAFRNDSDYLYLNGTCGVGHADVNVSVLGGGRCTLSFTEAADSNLAQSRRLLLVNGSAAHLVVYAWA